MKIHYRKPNLLEQMDMAVRDCNSPGTEPIDYFELTDDELNLYYGSFDKTAGNNNKILYSYKGISIKVNK
jgi:hypothetical protein